jgi:hypothetical protein
MRVRRALNSTQRYGGRFALAWRKRLLPRGHTLLVAAMPKSGSSFLVKTLAEATGFAQMFLGADHLNEQDLYLPALIDAWGLDIVAHQHLRATPANLRLLREFRIRPVVLRRDLADALVSLADHLQTDTLVTPVVTLPPAYRDWPRQQQLQAVLDLAAPWYLQFLAGWQGAAAEVDALMLDYAEVTRDPAAAVAAVLRHQGIARAGAEIAAAVARAQAAAPRFNQGVAGRGAAQFAPEQLAQLDAMARHVGLAGVAPAAA